MSERPQEMDDFIRKEIVAGRIHLGQHPMDIAPLMDYIADSYRQLGEDAPPRDVLVAMARCEGWRVLVADILSKPYEARANARPLPDTSD